MAQVGLVLGRGQPSTPAGLTVRSPLTLAEEHMLLLSQVTARGGTAHRDRAGPVARCRVGGAGRLRAGRGVASGV